MKFDPIACEDYVRVLISHDEVERALLVLDNVPAFYRDNYPDNLKTLKENILKSLCTPHAYLSSDLDSTVTEEKALDVLNKTERGVILRKEVERYNLKGMVPHIVDMGPGEYFVPIGLKKVGLKFTYKPIAFDVRAGLVAEPLIQDVVQEKSLPNQPIIFLALEVIEHLASIKDITVECLRHCGRYPDRVHLSTPQYTYDTNHDDWAKPCGLPHLRAYTPREFYEAGLSLFSGYQWELISGHIMSLRGVIQKEKGEAGILQ